MIEHNPIRILKLFAVSALCAAAISSCGGGIDKNLTVFPEWPEVLTPAIDGTDIGISALSGFRELTLTLTRGQELEFTGVGDASRAIDPTWFEYVSGSTVKFTGPDGQYVILYSNELKLILAYQRTEGLEYPDALWLMGDNAGFAQPPYRTCSGWGWNPVQSFFCRKTGASTFDVAVCLHNSFKLKFFRDKTWNTGTNSRDMTWIPSDFFGDGWYDNPQGGGHYTGDLVPGTGFTPGVYRITIDIAANTISAAALR